MKEASTLKPDLGNASVGKVIGVYNKARFLAVAFFNPFYWRISLRKDRKMIEKMERMKTNEKKTQCVVALLRFLVVGFRFTR